MKRCLELFLKKNKDYGTAWRILRTSSITDQIFIKAARIRSIEEKGVQQINDSIESEYVGIVNYSIMALIQLSLDDHTSLELSSDFIGEKYQHWADATQKLMQQKNHDYGEAWRDMRLSSLTDLILMKLLRIKQIEDNQGKTWVSEGLEANYQDIINYAIFALIKLNFDKN
ncbi:MAG: DUF1599 domain-containing protein [Saprospiraceae bacterium]|nr:DUF1599 domain-containing protein [Saprospiraceae bacterium]